MSEEPWFPEGYGQEHADAICDRLADGESLRAICRDDAMPSTSTVCKWLTKNADFAEQYARAREMQADALFDDILDIADDARNDWMEREGEGSEGWRENGEAIRRSQLRIEARKWMAGKLKGKYSDKVKHVGGDEGDAPIRFVKKAEDLSDEQLAAIAAGQV